MATVAQPTNPGLLKEEALRKQLAEFREARRQKMMMRLSRKNPNPSNIASLEAIAGIQRSRNPPELKYDNPEKKEAANTKKEADNAANKPKKKNLLIRQTATSMKRAVLTTGSFKPLVVFSAKSATNSVNKLLEAPQVRNLKTNPRLTIPRSPSFTHRAPRPVTATQKPIPNTKNMTPAMSAPKAIQKKVANQPPNKNEQAPVIMHKRKSSSWMVPLTPEKAGSVVDAAKNSPRTPKVKPFVRKSFSETKVPHKSIIPLNRTLNPIAAPKASAVVRRSASVSTLMSSRSSSRSSWMIPKEPSEKEKIHQWLEKRGRSIASCRHLGCLGHKLEDFSVPKRQESAHKSVMVIRSNVATEEADSASPQLKRQSAALNTTFEKDEELEEAAEVKPIALAIIDQEVETQQSTPDAVEDKFHTPVITAAANTVQPEEAAEESEDIVDLSSAAEGNIEKLLEAILGLFDQPIYPESKIENWLQKAEKSFPAIQSHALYWESKARLAYKRGDTDAALDIYSEALKNNVEPVELVGQLFDNFLQRIGAQLPTGQRTPFAKSLGLATPRPDRLSRFTPRKPQLDSSQIFPSSVVKYELKLKRIFRTMEKDLKENETATPLRKTRSGALKTPLKVEASTNHQISVAGGAADYKLVATPVRRSMRPKSMHMFVAEDVLYVDDLDQLTPKTRAKLEFRSNAALSQTTK